MALKYIALALAAVAAANAYEPDGVTLSYSVFPEVTREGVWTDESKYRAFRNSDEFLAVWKRQTDCDDSCARSILSSIDFTRNMLVVIAPRGRGQDTYDVVITAVTASQDSIEVSFLELRHGEARDGVLCGVLTAMPHPTLAILVSQSTKPVRFFRRRADVICEQPVEVK